MTKPSSDPRDYRPAQRGRTRRANARPADSGTKTRTTEVARESIQIGGTVWQTNPADDRAAYIKAMATAHADQARREGRKKNPTNDERILSEVLRTARTIDWKRSYIIWELTEIDDLGSFARMLKRSLPGGIQSWIIPQENKIFIGRRFPHRERSLQGHKAVSFHGWDG